MAVWRYPDRAEPLFVLHPLTGLARCCTEEFRKDPMVASVEFDGLTARQALRQTDVDDFDPSGVFEVTITGDDGEDVEIEIEVSR